MQSARHSCLGIDNEDKLIAEITMRVINFVSPTISVEEIQDLVRKGTDESTSRSG